MNSLSDDERARITAVILAGGEGRRMGGEDKGLMSIAGRSMVEHVLERVVPQAGRVLINANRNRAAYARLGHPVFSDEMHDFQGPLAGIATGLAQLDTPLLLTLPCDSPRPPEDLAARLYLALEREQAQIAVVHDGHRLHPVFALIRREVLPSLRAYLDAGNRKLELWFNLQRTVVVDFSNESDAFVNVNSPAERAALEAQLTRSPGRQV